MEVCHSFEQRSLSDLGHEIETKKNRIILVNRKDPTVSWSTANCPTKLSKDDYNNDTKLDKQTFKTSQYSKSTAGKTATSSRPSCCLLKRFCDLLCCRESTNKGPSSIRSLATWNGPQQIDCGPFPLNEWRTSKYTLINFLPKNLFEQFRRFANFYFLTTAILQIILPFSPVGPTTSLLPLMFVVSTTAIKQAYEDYLRHKIDRELNNRICHIMKNKRLIKIKSKDIKVGDFVYVKNNEEIPCDMILLAAGGGINNINDRCYVTTANLDGETSLKSRSCFQILEQLGDIKQLDQMLLVVECEKPNATLYDFNGSLRAPKNNRAYDNLMKALNDLESEYGYHKDRKLANSHHHNVIGQTIGSGIRKNSSNYRRGSNVAFSYQRLIAQTILNKMTRLSSKHNTSDQQQQTNENNKLDSLNQSDFHEIPLDITNLLLRASRLRNSSFVYGLAVYTGRDTKLAQNSQVKPNKFSSTESTVNIFLLISFFILMAFSLIGTIRYKILFEPNDSKKTSQPYQEVFVAHFLLYNYLIPISLYVTLEFVKFFGTLAVVDDKKMRSIVWQTIAFPRSIDSNSIKAIESKTSFRTKKRFLEGPKCNSSDLNEELGQVEVLFSDKTGTLTENKMLFKACSIRGSLYRSINDQLYHQPEYLFGGQILNVAHKLAKVKSNRSSMINWNQQESTGSISNKSPSSPSKPLSPSSSSASKKKKERSLSSSEIRERKKAKSKPFDHRLHPPLENLESINRLEDHEKVTEFFIGLCLCSTITINEQIPLEDCLPDKTQNEYDFQSASPDEESLIEAAHSFGITMCKSNDRECFIVIDKDDHSHRANNDELDRAKQVKSPVVKEERTHKHTGNNDKIDINSRSKSRHDHRPRPGVFKALVQSKYSNDKYFIRHFVRLLVFEFSSVRKRMTVVYKDCDNDVILMITKGSEELLDCLQIDMKAEKSIDLILSHFEAFAMSGLRTLLVAKKIISLNEYEKIMTELKEAKLSIHNRDELTSAAYRRAENGLSLIGTTAVEDTLQEGVPETIANLKEAGIKVWLLTGDKVETAISVAYLCKLLDRDMTLFHLVRQQDLQACQKLLNSFEEQMEAHECNHDHDRVRGKSNKPTSNNHHRFRYALIADGRSLHYAMKYSKNQLAKLSKQCVSVLGCRLSPLQKAEVVDMIKQSEENPITAAIGDGANDVSMIQEAHVGIGISGKEGKQAVNCSDFAISRFQMLNRLLFVHGHLFYHRTANIIHYFFYKNLLFVLPQFLYSCHNDSSTLSLYHPILLIGYNLIFTSLPVLVYGLMEANIPEYELETYPRLYRSNRANSQLSLRLFFGWLIMAALQSMLAFYLLDYITYLLESGKSDCVNGFAIALSFIIISTATVRLYSIAYSRNIYLNISTLLSCISLPAVLYGYSLFDMRAIISDNSLYQQVEYYLTSSLFWISFGLVTFATIIPDIFWHIQDRLHHSSWLNKVMAEK